MGKSREADSQSLQKYGVPLYSAAWLPYKELRSNLPSHDDHVDSSKQQEQQEEEIPEPSASSNEYYVILAGGGGEGSSGIPNAVLLSCFDFSSNSLSSQPVRSILLIDLHLFVMFKISLIFFLYKFSVCLYLGILAGLYLFLLYNYEMAEIRLGID